MNIFWNKINFHADVVEDIKRIESITLVLISMNVKQVKMIVIQRKQFVSIQMAHLNVLM